MLNHRDAPSVSDEMLAVLLLREISKHLLSLQWRRKEQLKKWRFLA